MSTKAPAFQFYPNDFLGSGKVALMTPEEVGAYILLLCLDWNEGGFVYDEKRLARYCRMRASRFKTLWQNTLSCCFDELESGRFANHRLQAEREKQERYRVAMQANGAKGGRPPKKPRVSNSFSQEKLIESIPVTSLQSPSKKQDPKAVAAAPDAPSVSPPVVPPPARRTKGEPAPWMGEANAAWRAAYGGDLPKGAATVLRPLVTAHGIAAVLEHFARYLGETGAAYASVPRFAQTFGAWAPLPEPGPDELPNFAGGDVSDFAAWEARQRGGRAA